jgi:hypothetical protein
MANTVTNVLPKLLAQGVLALRENAVMSRLVNRDYANLASQKGAVINVPIPSAIAARDVTPANAMATNVDFAPTAAQVTLDFWKEAPFQMSDKDVEECMEGTIPMQASEAIKSLANAVDAYIIGKHTGIFGITGTAGTTPFNTSLNAAAAARTLLNKQLAPMTDRQGVIDADAEQNFLLNANILQADQRGDAGGIISGTIGTKLGVNWYMDQNITAAAYTPGTAWITGWTSDGSGAVGASTLAVVFTNSGSVKIGDIFTLGTQGYVITAVATAVTAVTMNIAFYPPLKAAVATASVLTIGAGATAYVPNIVMHRDAFAWASRPLSGIAGVGDFQSVVDPVTGIALRLELSRQYKQTTFSYDILGGANLVRRELAVKIKG